MINPIQLLRDFKKWRKEKYDTALNLVCVNESFKSRFNGDSRRDIFAEGIRYGIEHRKEILKQVKI